MAAQHKIICGLSVLLAFALAACGHESPTVEPPNTAAVTPLADATATAAAIIVAQALDGVPTDPSADNTPQQPAATPAAASTPTATPMPTDTPIPAGTPTETSTPTSVATALRQANVGAAPLNLRSTPSTDGALIGLLAEGVALTILERSADGLWLHVRLQDGRVGWAYAEYVTESNSAPADAQGAIDAIPCAVAVHATLAARWSRDSMGCPTSSAGLTWATWQTFERGNMLWREDTKTILSLTASGTWRSTPDRWNGEELGSPYGSPPAGLAAPLSGFGFVWTNDARLFAALGWATDQERGTCLIVQRFEKGEMMKSVGEGCNNGLYSHGQEPSFGLQYLSLEVSGRYSR